MVRNSTNPADNGTSAVSNFYPLHDKGFRDRYGLGLYQFRSIPFVKKGMFGIFTHPLIHSGFKHLLTNTLPLFFLSWCLFTFTEA